MKFKLIHELEQHLPVALFDYEWQIAEQGRGKSYSPVTRIERWIPLVFIALHVILAVMIILAIAGAMDWAK